MTPPPPSDSAELTPALNIPGGPAAQPSLFDFPSSLNGKRLFDVFSGGVAIFE